MQTGFWQQISRWMKVLSRTGGQGRLAWLALALLIAMLCVGLGLATALLDLAGSLVGQRCAC